jgi:hypothetical protein
MAEPAEAPAPGGATLEETITLRLLPSCNTRTHKPDLAFDGLSSSNPTRPASTARGFNPTRPDPTRQEAG